MAIVEQTVFFLFFFCFYSQEKTMEAARVPTCGKILASMGFRRATKLVILHWSHGRHVIADQRGSRGYTVL